MTAATAAARDILSEDRVLEGEEARRWCRSLDVGAVAFPNTPEEAVALVRAAARAKMTMLPAGLGSWLRAGGWGRSADMVISTARMNTLHDYEPADLTLTAGAGMTLADLAETLRPNGQWLPADAPGSAAGTLGALLACGASGPLKGLYGGVRDNVLGVEMVTGDGRVLRFGGRVVKNVAGYDLVRLLTGSRGSLGLLTSVSVRLFPLPAADITLLFAGGPWERLVALAAGICRMPLPLAAVELVERGEEAAVAVRVTGSPKEAREICARIQAEAGETPQAVWRDAESAAFHQSRITWEDGAAFVARIAALPSRLARSLDCARRIAADIDGEVTAHALQGVARVKGATPIHKSDEWAARLSRLRQTIGGYGGTLTISQAPGELAAKVGWTGDGGAAERLDDRIKALFDPWSLQAATRP